MHRDAVRIFDDLANGLPGTNVESASEVLDDRAVTAAGHHVLVIRSSREEGRRERGEVDVVGILPFVHREQRAERAAHVRIDVREEGGHRPLEVGLAFDVVDVGRAHEEPSHRGREGLAGVDVGKDAGDAVENSRADRDAGVRCRHALDAELGDERQHRRPRAVVDPRTAEVDGRAGEIHRVRAAADPITTLDDDDIDAAQVQRGRQRVRRSPPRPQ